MTTELGRLLEEVAGISPDVLGDKNLARAVRERMSTCKLPDEEQYLEKVRSSSWEMEALIEAVVVPETSFFRDKGPFTFLDHYIRGEVARVRATAPLRILSAPCSSGEEPYSVAMVMQEAGLKPEEYSIDALDISRALLRKAERAVYTPHSFRGVPEPFRDRYFAAVGREYVLKDEVRRRVHFIHGNLLDERLLSGKRPYDILFCRNLLIYFGAKARARVLRTIDRLLLRGGLLFVGHAETACFPSERFAPLDPRGAFGFRKVKIGEVETPAGEQVSLPPIVASPPQVRVEPDARQEKRHLPASMPEKPQLRDSFKAARQLADQGYLYEAAAMCERLLLDDGVTADAYCLLGTVLHGLGNLRRAEECFNRAVYLDARCYDAVVHLSLIREHRGDSAGAEVLRRRAVRIRRQTRTS